MFPVSGPSVPISSSPTAALQRNLRGEASKHKALQVFFFLFFWTATESQPRNRQKVFLHVFVLKLVLFTGKRFLMSFALPLPGLTFICRPSIELPVCFSSACVIPPHPLLPLLLHLFRNSGLKQRSLNHICDGRLATTHLLY